MATGTGKTRLAIGLIYRLITTGRFRRILFVVDRNALGEQAGDKFKETRLEELKTFDQIFDLKEVDESQIEATTKVKIASVQALMHAIMYPSDTREVPSVGQYDCIIVDESHRGYTLDRELGEAELLYRDQNDYLSKYRRVIEYFDAVKIGLTATPAPHTAEIFGKPVFTYTYREAVVDGWLVDHEPPHQLGTRLAKEGIKWKKGDIIPVYDPETKQITNIEVSSTGSRLTCPQTVTLYPWVITLFAIGKPTSPRPMKPTLSAMPKNLMPTCADLDGHHPP